MNDEIAKLYDQAIVLEGNGDYVAGELDIVKFAALVAAHEREACAKVCDGKVDAEYATGKVDHNEMSWSMACAIAIRARGEKS